MKEFVCIVDRTFFNMKIWRKGELLKADDELAKTVKTSWFQPKEEYDADHQVVVKKIEAAARSNKTVEEVIIESEKEKKKLKEEISKLSKKE